ncbi:PREDICTED: uncharacterized protein LOC105363170 [Ceratosolen solmsi marchali]|uniref:Uncharacterized protein LOC105363170 n=1 Tax=Ceratosolen solmsi marchali TaxID=326594 RepID=A0AAJ7DWL5_9HYME|nr:PREDICTED: uncharacterized protein LOC105363170 [Ceratosolen solmsi marchali]
MLRTWFVLLPLLLEAIHPLLGNGDGLVLLYPQSTVFQFTIGMSMPVATNKRGSIVFSSGFQFNYVLPWNLTQFEPTVVHARASPQAQPLRLENIYMVLEDVLEKNGWSDGQECVLRTICELAEAPLARSGGDVVEEIIHLLLTPSEDSGEDDYPSRRSEIKRYEEAEILGRSGTGCGQAYGGCSRLPLDSITRLLAFES